MPNSKFHQNFNLLLVLPACCLAAFFLLYSNTNEILIFAACFFYATLFANPDMDLANQIKLFSLTGILSLPFKLFYAPFMKHRSKKLSHHFLWGTISRLLALIIFMIFCLFLYYCFLEIKSSGLNYQDLPSIFQKIITVTKSALTNFYQIIQYNFKLIVYGLAGFFIADISHILLDKLGR